MFDIFFRSQFCCCRFPFNFSLIQTEIPFSLRARISLHDHWLDVHNSLRFYVNKWEFVFDIQTEIWFFQFILSAQWNQFKFFIFFSSNFNHTQHIVHFINSIETENSLWNYYSNSIITFFFCRIFLVFQFWSLNCITFRLKLISIDFQNNLFSLLFWLKRSQSLKRVCLCVSFSFSLLTNFIYKTKFSIIIWIWKRKTVAHWKIKMKHCELNDQHQLNKQIIV